MTEIRFTRDYRGKLTQEFFFEAGTTASFSSGAALQIIAEGAAELVEPEQTEEPQEETPEETPEAGTAKPTRKRRTKSK